MEVKHSFSYALITSTAVLGLAMPALAAGEELAEAARKEGSVTIYAATDQAQAQAALDAFTKKYPGIRIDYNDIGTNGVYNRVISEAAAKQVGGDVFWTSAMDQGVKLAVDGYLEAYKSSEAASLPSWAIYKDIVYATSVEPIGMIYNKTALSEDKVPQTREDLIKFISSGEYNGRIATFDPEKSGVGFLIQTNDLDNTSNFWELTKALGTAKGKSYSSTGSMRETVVSGENVLAYNLIGSYALDWVKSAPNLGVAFGKDYTPAFSRVAGVLKDAPHPNAGKLFIDFLLSQEGQSALASKGMPALRKDTTEGYNMDTLNELVGGNLKPIALDETLLNFMDPTKRMKFLNEWRSALKG
ncbi:ABC transporter substrate-binding protein [Pseudochrobactrum asaccharolyticum]|uniref:Iron(III) transport system substrate-binding protein n=1 Tax=Pseudochrobactrum asaccharolyticum TaxID=354351 RepID=A0A366DZJ7_9HYPH|nr:ABC transporter substrate-binding protein [Pseudochrobactrum asaccharolyticum]RBO95536.1 iron(III) transport system substrate-binding protein [Pseudochrobactrum asaccharolyticum]